MAPPRLRQLQQLDRRPRPRYGGYVRTCCGFKWREAIASPVPAFAWAELADTAKSKRCRAVVDGA